MIDTTPEPMVCLPRAKVSVGSGFNAIPRRASYLIATRSVLCITDGRTEVELFGRQKRTYWNFRIAPHRTTPSGMSSSGWIPGALFQFR